jgi:segregation and condensation protein B
MEVNAIKHILEAGLLAANASLPLDKLAELFSARGVEVERSELREALGALANDYAEREIELKETASGFRIQIKSSAREWLQPLFEERAPRYTRALLETLALIAYRQPITRGEIEEVRGVAVSTNIVRTLMERGWIRVVGFREVPGRPSMLGTTKEFLDYFGLKKLDDLPPLAELREIGPDADPQSDFVDELAAVIEESGEPADSEQPIQASVETAEDAVEATAEDSAEEEAEPAPNVVPIHQSEA